MSTALWYHWLDIGTAHTAEATAHEADDDLAPELQASLIAIAAAAFCIDALSAEVELLHPILPTTRAAWKVNGTAQWKQVAEIFFRGFTIEHAARYPLRSELKWLFGARNMGVHHAEKVQATKVHPGRMASVSVENWLYCSSNARRASDIVFALLDACEHSMRGTAWAKDHLRVAGPLRARLTS